MKLHVRRDCVCASADKCLCYSINANMMYRLLDLAVGDAVRILW
jgi:hypothetical protein